MNCQGCGAGLPAGSKFCVACGAPQGGAARPMAAAALGHDPALRMILPVGRSPWAIAAGYLGLFSFCLVPAPFAVAVSLVALRDLKKHPDRHGMGRAVFGLVLGVLGTLVLVAAFFVRP